MKGTWRRRCDARAKHQEIIDQGHAAASALRQKWGEPILRTAEESERARLAHLSDGDEAGAAMNPRSGRTKEGGATPPRPAAVKHMKATLKRKRKRAGS
jgi:hypothetical protein